MSPHSPSADRRLTTDPWLFDPEQARAAVLARRPADGDAVACVVSDAVWFDVVRLLRWAASAQHSSAELAAGAWWRLAVDCASLLRRLPRFMDELGEGYVAVPIELLDAGLPDDAPAADRVSARAARLAELLAGDGPCTLAELADRVGDLGSVAISASVGATDWSDVRA